MLRRFTFRQMRRALPVSLLVLGGGFSAHATLIVMEQAQAHSTPSATRPAGFEMQEHFPGAALLYEVDETGTPAIGAPATGATGTIALPRVPLPHVALAQTLTGDTSVKPAAPFSMVGVPMEARGRAQQCLTAAIYYEAASESEEGQRAVAQVVLNRMRHPAFPNSICGVVYQGSERGHGCQFSFACDGSMARVPSRTGWARASRYAEDALNGYVVASVGAATHYHTYAVNPAWNKSLVMTAAIGAHFFQRWKGFWGTPGAFHQAYARIEPFPGPKPRPTTALAASAVVPSAATPSYAPGPYVQPAFADSRRPRADAAPEPTPAAATSAGALPQTTMLDKWAGTGQPLQ